MDLCVVSILKDLKTQTAIVVAVWKNSFSYEMDDEPIHIVRITTDDFREVVVDRFTGKYVEQLSMSVFYNFLSTGCSSF